MNSHRGKTGDDLRFGHYAWPSLRQDATWKPLPERRFLTMEEVTPTAERQRGHGAAVGEVGTATGTAGGGAAALRARGGGGLVERS